jgi:glutamyl-tRNA synthetase
MLSVVVDDHDMGITHVIRGDDHLTNTFRQLQLYNAMSWPVPEFAHVPMIHGPDGAKLSKRHGAVGLEAYRDMGYLPEAMRNYLLRLGWGHGDAEIIDTAQAIEWFDLDGIGRSPSRFDMVKLDNLNGHYLRAADNNRLVELLLPRLEKRLERPVDELGLARLRHGMDGLKLRAKTLEELADNALFYVRARPLPIDQKAAALLTPPAKQLLRDNVAALGDVGEWTAAKLEEADRAFATQRSLRVGQIAQPKRAALTGSTTSPGIYEVMEVLGREESLARLGDQLETG